MGHPADTATLREYLLSTAPDYGRRADVLWKDIAPPLHERQTRTDENIGGGLHAKRVEEYIWRLICESRQLDEFRPIELFILSCAACTHDFDKGLKSCIPDDSSHGIGSGVFVLEHRGELILSNQEAIAVDKLDAMHGRQGNRYVEALNNLPDPLNTTSGPIDLRRLAVVLKAADGLHTDASRTSDLTVDPNRLESKPRSKHLARGCFTGWRVDGSRIIIQAFPRTPEERMAANTSFELLNENEWRPIAGELHRHHFPDHLELDIRADYLTGPRRAASPNKAEPRNMPGMDYYHEEDAAGFAGRDDDREKLERLIYAYPAVRLVGPSGVGKSSLLHAGLKPAVEGLSGWACIITRPSEECLCTPDDFRSVLPDLPSDTSLAALCTAALKRVQTLLVVFDQFEDVAYFGSFNVDAAASDLLAAVRVDPKRVKLLFAHRDDAESLLGELWQRVGASARGLPTHHLQRLSRNGARDALLRLLEREGIQLEPSSMINVVLDELVASTRREASLDRAIVYPPFLQMVAARLRDLAIGGRVEERDYRALAGSEGSAVDCIIAEYLERSLDDISSPADWSGSDDEWKRATRAVLTVLARSTGTRGVASESRIAAEAGVENEQLAALLPALDRGRLIRRLAGGEWEVIHDVLARRIMEKWVSDQDRRFKHAREALESRARMLHEHHALLSTTELRELWLLRDRIPLDSLSRTERIVLFVSMFGSQLQDVYSYREDAIRPWLSQFTPDLLGVPGWYWMSGLDSASIDMFWRDVAETGDPIGIRSALACICLLPTREDLPLLKECLKDSELRVHGAAAEAIGKLGTREDLSLLKECLKDDDSGVRGAAAEA
ncbi:MAG: HEAT repeat domain-containing protein, partial [Phycisphaerae bacterium]|nr:HEAT repeat domain-containing protein [Phycisphaerae bacterium]